MQSKIVLQETPGAGIDGHASAPQLAGDAFEKVQGRAQVVDVFRCHEFAILRADAIADASSATIGGVMRLRWMLPLLCVAAVAAELHVSPVGDDRGPGTKARPLRTWEGARQRLRGMKRSAPVTVWFRGGVYPLARTMVLTAADSGTREAPVTYAAMPGEEVVISGGTRLQLAWRRYRGGILSAAVPPGFTTDQLFVNGKRMPMARYPNYDEQVLPLNGWAADAVSPERAARWKSPAGGFVHALHKHMWGGFHYLITGKDATGAPRLEGGWQNNRQLGMHEKFRFVENVFEELDAPGEWFLDRAAGRLYFYPPAEVNPRTAAVEGVRLRHLVEVRGARFLNLSGFTFRHAARTFMETREPLLRSDWTIYRGGALFVTGAEDVSLNELTFDQVGGNAIFVSGYNRRVAIRRAHIFDAGANGVSFAGDARAVRSPLFEYGQRQNLSGLDLTPGPKTDDYPADCTLEDSLIYRTGRVEKQTAPVQISMARRITVRQCSLYDVPRAGINVSEGTWGGHLIEGCDVFDTVKETGDHGSFNSWGRDRYWGLTGVPDGRLGDYALLDAVEPTVIRNSRWRCDHGWDIDLDDGSSHYVIRNNLTLRGGIKLREGFLRVVENNILVNNSFHPHVWYPGSRDVFRRNIVFTEYKPIRVAAPWGEENDYNLLHRPGQTEPAAARELQKQSGRDEHSLAADARFSDAPGGSFRLRGDSPALELGFEPFALDRFGVQWPKLKALARTPEMAAAAGAAAKPGTARDAAIALWLGARVRNLIGQGEVSAAGTPGETGVLVLEVPAQSRGAAADLRPQDVILELDGERVRSLADLLRLSARVPEFGMVRIGVWRAQQPVQLLTEAPLPPAQMPVKE